MSFLNEFNLFSFAAGIHRPLILDGPMGSLLQQRGVSPHPSLWMSHSNLLYPEKVLSIHNEYIEAGADIITTNTFRTNPLSAEHGGKEQLKAAILLAKEAKGNKSILIAGSNAPAEDCYQKERKYSLSKLEYNHCKHIDLLIDNGVDFILNETQSHLDEISIISEYCAKNRIPFVMSLFVDKDLKLLSGEDISSTLKYVREHAPLALGINCIMPSDFLKIPEQLKEKDSLGFYLNCGDGSYSDHEIKCSINAEEYRGIVKESLKMNPSFIGACCGASPEHIKKIKELFRYVS